MAITAQTLKVGRFESKVRSLLYGLDVVDHSGRPDYALCQAAGTERMLCQVGLAQLLPVAAIASRRRVATVSGPCADLLLSALLGLALVTRAVA